MGHRVKVWSAETIRNEKWIRYGIHPGNRDAGKLFMKDFLNWFDGAAINFCMISEISLNSCFTIAFSDRCDVVIFLIMFGGSVLMKRIFYPLSNPFLV